MFIGIDLGTSAIKGIAVDESGRIRAKARHAYPTSRPEFGAAEQNPADWWTALDAVVGQLTAAVPGTEWTGIGLSAMLPTLVEIDRASQVMNPSITWEDSRAEADAAALCAAVGEGELYRVTGQRVDGRYLAPMHARLRRLGKAGVTVAGAKDVLFEHLTGELVTDPSTAAGFAVFDIENGSWDAELVDAAGLAGLPAVAPSATALPLLNRWSDRWGLPPGLPVVLGAADSVLGAVGVGAEAPGDVAVIAGTSAIVLGISERPIRDAHRRYLVTPLTGSGWGLEMDLLAMGSAFQSVADLFGLDGPAALMAAAETVPIDDAPVFLPYLTPGEQGALWDPDLTGVLHGLRLGTGAADICRALLTGVVVELRRCLAVLGRAADRRGPVLLGGGSAVTPLLWQDLADASGREVRVDPRVSDHSAIGAAVFAGRTLTGTQPVPMLDTHTVTPRAEAYQAWLEIAGRHDELRLTQRKFRSREPA